MSDPITREETYLAALSGESVNLPDPITRTEMYLAYLNGMAVNIPAPITRKDFFLYTLCMQGTGGGGTTIRNQDKTVTANGQYTADSGYTGLGTVTVNVPQEEPVVEPLEVTENGTYNPPDGVDGYGPVTVNVAASGGGGGADIARAIVDRTITEYSDSGVTAIKDFAFYNCTKLSAVNIPNAVTIGNNSFENCSAVKELSVPSVTSVGGSAFKGSKALETAIFPSVGRTGSRSFMQCSALKMYSAEKAQYVNDNCFHSCTALTDVSVPSAFDIGGSAFYSCSNLKKLILPKASNIAQYAFDASALEVLVLANDSVATLQNIGAFQKTPFASGGTGGTVYVPSALISAYQTATNWSTLYAAGSLTFAAIEGSEYE